MNQYNTAKTFMHYLWYMSQTLSVEIAWEMLKSEAEIFLKKHLVHAFMCIW